MLGESGTGKEACAKALHELSGRTGPMNAVNMATLDTSVGVAQLMGIAADFVQKGMSVRRGLIEAAHGGTVFLDEIAQVAPAVQDQLLRAVLQGEIVRAGEDARKVDVRFIAATNRDPNDEELMKFDFVGRFPDRVWTPSLEARREDIPLIARHLVLELAGKSKAAPARRSLRTAPGRSSPDVSFDPAFIDAMLDQAYRTNVNEMRTMISASIAESRDGVLRKPTSPDIKWRKRPTIATVKCTVEEALAAVARNDNNKQKAADELGLSRHQLKRLLKKESA